MHGVRSIDRHLLRKKTRKKGVLEMHNKEDSEKTEVCIMDALDQATKLRAAIGYLADTAQSAQLAAVLWVVEETAEMLERLLEVLAKGETISTKQASEG
jgi:hypothetical protein